MLIARLQKNFCNGKYIKVIIIKTMTLIYITKIYIYLKKIHYFTSSTRPNPPTPRVSMMLKSERFRLEKKAFSASYLKFKTAEKQ